VGVDDPQFSVTDRPVSLPRRTVLKGLAGVSAGALLASEQTERSSAQTATPGPTPTPRIVNPAAAVASDYASLWNPDTVTDVFLAAYLEERFLRDGWQLNGEPVTYTDLQAATVNGALPVEDAGQIGSPTSFLSVQIIKPLDGSWTEVEQLRIFTYPSSEAATAGLDTMLARPPTAGETDLSSRLPPDHPGRLVRGLADLQGFPVVQTTHLFSARNWTFAARHLGVDQALLNDDADIARVQALCDGLPSLAAQFATAGRIVRRFVSGYQDTELVQIAASFRAPRFAGMAGYRRHFQKFRETVSGFYGEQPEVAEERRQLNAGHACHSIVRGTLPEVPVSYEHHARNFISSEDAAAFFDTEDAQSHEQVDFPGQLELSPDFRSNSTKVAGSFARWTTAEATFAGYHTWLLTGPVLNSFLFFDLANPSSGSEIDPAGMSSQQMKAGSRDVVEQFERSLIHLSPWPEFAVPDVWTSQSSLFGP
jgi:hypothetical protein